MLGTKIRNIVENKIFAKLYFFIAPFILLLCMDILRFANISYPQHLLTPFLSVKILITYIYILLFFCFFCAIVRHKPTAYLITSVILWFMSFVSTLMAEFTGDPLLPSDVLLATNANDIASFIKIKFDFFILVSLLLMIFSIYIYYRCNRYEEKIKLNFALNSLISIAFVGIFVLSSYLLCFSNGFRYKFLKSIDVNIAAFNPIEDYDGNGLVLTFFPRVGSLFVEKPDNYSPEVIAEIKERKPENKAVKTPDEMPAIIAIQNEAWWDTSLIPNVAITPDPMEKTRKIMEEGHGGKLISTVYAGGTCMPEFEFLTGLSSALLPSGTYPYIQHIVNEKNSIVREFKNNGYETIAFHPYKRNFYNRSKAYPLIGFDEFLGIDNTGGLVKSGGYISDMSVTDKIIECYENRQKENFFMFSVTMQNHGGYERPRYENYDVTVTGDTLSSKDLNGVKDHAQGVYEADIAFEKLVNYFKTVDKPVVIVMYGDHLPLLGTNMSTLKDGGFVPNKEGINMADYPSLYETPYVLWTNYDTSEYILPERMSAAALGLTVMKMSGIENTAWYFDTATEFYSKYPAYHQYFVFNPSGEQFSDIAREDKQLLEDYKMIQYDVLHGKNYYLKGN